MNRTALRRVVLAAAGFLIVVVIIAAIAGGDEDDSTPAPTTAGTSSTAEQQEQTQQEPQAQEQAQQPSQQQEQTQEQAQQEQQPSPSTTPAPQTTREMTIDEYAAWCYAFGRVAATETAADYTDTYFQHLHVLRRVPSELVQFHIARADIMVTMATFLEGDYDPDRPPDTVSPIRSFNATVEDLRPSTRATLEEAGCAY